MINLILHLILYQTPIVNDQTWTFTPMKDDEFDNICSIFAHGFPAWKLFSAPS